MNQRLDDEQYERLNHEVWELSFDNSGGLLKSGSQKVIITHLIYYYYKITLNLDFPEIYPFRKTLVVDYQHFKKVMGYRYEKTFLRELNQLADIGLINLNVHPDKKYFDVSLNIEAIINAPKIKGLPKWQG